MVVLSTFVHRYQGIERMDMKIVVASAMMMMVMMITVVSSSSPATTCSGCPVKHPQQQFCDSEVVIRGRVRTGQRVKVRAVYKGLESVVARGTRLTIPFEAPDCKKANLVPGSTYLMTGRYHDNILHISACDAVEPWLSLSSVQRNGVKEAYQLFCDQCSINSTFFVIRPQQQLAWDFQEGNDVDVDVEPSSFWRTEDCFYNPLASSSYGVEDCETRHSFCVPHEGGRCAWLETDKYAACADRRDTNSCLAGFGALAMPAWRCRQDCLTVPKGCLRDMCLRSTAGVQCSEELQHFELGPSIRLEKK